MTLEAKIDKTNELLAGILAQLTANAEHAGRPVAAGAPGAKAPAAGAKKASTTQPPANPANPTATTPPAPAANDAAAKLDYEKDVKAPMMELAKTKGRGAVQPIFDKFEVANAKVLNPEQWPAFIAAVAAAQADASIPLVTPTPAVA